MKNIWINKPESINPFLCEPFSWGAHARLMSETCELELHCIITEVNENNFKDTKKLLILLGSTGKFKIQKLFSWILKNGAGCIKNRCCRMCKGHTSQMESLYEIKSMKELCRGDSHSEKYKYRLQSRYWES